MNWFQAWGDLLHLIGCIVLAGGLAYYRSAQTVSVRSIDLWMLVYLTRYSDFWYYGQTFSTYVIFYKIMFLSITFLSIFLARRYHAINPLDSKHAYWGIIAALLLALLFPSAHDDFAWSFSEYLEAVAILPQLLLLRETRGAQHWVALYVCLLGVYRLLYVFNWIYRFHTDPAYAAYGVSLSWVCGGVQTLLFLWVSMYVLLRRFSDQQWINARDLPVHVYQRLAPPVSESLMQFDVELVNTI